MEDRWRKKAADMEKWKTSGGGEKTVDKETWKGVIAGAVQQYIN